MSREKHLKMPPREIVMAIKGLDNAIRFAILTLLSKHQELSFTELNDILKIKKGSLAHHLEKLMNAALVKNYSKKELKGPYESYYAPTEFGRIFLSAIFESLAPPRFELMPPPRTMAAEALFPPYRLGIGATEYPSLEYVPYVK